MPQNKRYLCARVLTICPDGRIVVIQKEDGHVEFPGGGMLPEDKDDPVLTALRELWEETGIFVDEVYRLSELKRYRKDSMHEWLCYKLTLTYAELKWYCPESPEGKVMIIDPEMLRDEYGTRMTENQLQILNSHINELIVTT